MRAILTYHSIDARGSPISTAPEVFRAHCDWLAAGGVRTMTLTELLATPAAAPAVAITFDDAFVSFAELAWPLLRERRIPVTLFVPTADVGGDNGSWESLPGIPELPILGWEALARLAAEGVELGSHGRTHRDLRRLGDAVLRRELEDSRDEIAERTGEAPATLAYPYGRHDDRVATAAGRVYELACTTELRPLRATDDRRRLPRIDAFYLRRPALLRAWRSPALRGYLRLRHLIRTLRGRLQA